MFRTPLNQRTVTVKIKRAELCDLLLACTLIDRASDGQKWAKLHDKLKAVLDDFDRKTESET